MAYQLSWVNDKAIFIERQQWYYLSHSWRDKKEHIFPNSISQKVNVKAQKEFKLASDTILSIKQNLNS